MRQYNIFMRPVHRFQFKDLYFIQKAFICVNIYIQDKT